MLLLFTSCVLRIAVRHNEREILFFPSFFFHFWLGSTKGEEILDCILTNVMIDVEEEENVPRSFLFNLVGLIGVKAKINMCIYTYMNFTWIIVFLWIKKSVLVVILGLIALPSKFDTTEYVWDTTKWFKPTKFFCVILLRRFNITME